MTDERIGSGRRSIRLAGYDYTLGGAYFLTFCIERRLPLFGEIRDKEMHLSDAGRMVAEVWEELPLVYPGVISNAYSVMPNHFHCVLILAARYRNEADGSDGTPPILSVGDVVHRFKVRTTHLYGQCVRLNGWPPYKGRLWQRNYFEHIIGTDKAMGNIQDYIYNNPAQWETDMENPRRRKGQGNSGPAESWRV